MGAPEAYFDEKSSATRALGEFAKHTGVDFMPYLPKTMEVLVEMSKFGFTDVRKNAIGSLTGTLVPPTARPVMCEACCLTVGTVHGRSSCRIRGGHAQGVPSGAADPDGRVGVAAAASPRADPPRARDHPQDPDPRDGPRTFGCICFRLVVYIIFISSHQSDTDHNHTG